MEEEGLIIKEIKWGGEKWKVRTVHIKKRLGRVLKMLKGKVEKKKGEKGSKEGLQCEDGRRRGAGGRRGRKEKNIKG